MEKNNKRRINIDIDYWVRPLGDAIEEQMKRKTFEKEKENIRAPLREQVFLHSLAPIPFDLVQVLFDKLPESIEIYEVWKKDSQI